MKKYIKMIVVFLPDGTILPRAVVWDSGEVYEIRRVCETRSVSSLSACGSSIRYTCLIHGQIRDLFLEGSRWFVDTNDD